MKRIENLAKEREIKHFSLYGENVAKVENEKGRKKGKLVLVSAMTSNKSGIGKTTMSIALADALELLGKNAMLALREPSMGPVFGIKGGATGGGKSVLVPSDEINLHFTGDFHAVAAANNLLASIVDNHIFQGNQLGIDTSKIFFKRCLDVNDRSLREIEYKIGKKKVVTGFNITAASEVMAILCLCEDLQDLKAKLGNIMVALDEKGKPVFARDLHAEEAMTLLLKDAIRPNLVQTALGTPALVHFGPFANIAHGCNSVVATKFALSHADFCITEAGFGSDLGAEKFLDIKTRILGKTPDVTVLVVTLAVVLEHGCGNLEHGFENVKKHIQNLQEVFGCVCAVAINQHANDDKKQLQQLEELCKNLNQHTFVCQPFAKGGKGCLDLANAVVELSKKKSSLQYAYEMQDSVQQKIEKIATRVYGASKVEFSSLAKKKLQLVKRFGFENFFVNVAKTQFSFSDDKTKLGAPTDFVFHVSDLEIRSGANMVVAIAGDMLLMPGLGKKSNYLNMKVDKTGKIEGLF